ncbi:hypothetical protein KC19_4G095000 [Ceratodon purpureus]|uniref:SS18 N-terminal domain-containing protein n=1 Tax=Ceratodon purpureus TaxID=3225 RepID=A0A8T0I8V3_CERPU|nr:hypothetical protein KC19_4G095000 [Ceratodon purpureus]
MPNNNMPPHMPPYATTNVTTEVIQRYLDENKLLILAILDNQQTKPADRARYQAKLQQNLMYLGAIADAYPQPGHHVGQSSQAVYAPQPLATMPPSPSFIHQQQQMMMMNQGIAMRPSYLQQSQAQASQQQFYNRHSSMLMNNLNLGLGVHDRVLMPPPGHPDHGGQGGHGDGNPMPPNVQGDLQLGGSGREDATASYLKNSDGSGVSGAQN